MEEGTANPRDTSQRRAYDVHGVGLYTGSFTNTACFNITPAYGVGSESSGYDLGLGVDNNDAGLSPYNSLAATGFTNGASQGGIVAPYANDNNFGDGIGNHFDGANNGIDFISHAPSNATVPGTAYDQNLSAGLPLQYSNNVYPTHCANTGFYSPNNGVPVGMVHGDNGYVTSAAALGTRFAGSMPAISNTSSPSTLGVNGAQYALDNNNVYPSGYVTGSYDPSINADATAFGTGYGSNGYATDGTTYDVPSMGTTTTVSGSLPDFTTSSVGNHYLQRADRTYSTGNANGTSYQSDNSALDAFGTAHGSTSTTNTTNSTPLAAQSPGTTPPTRSTLSPPAPGSIPGPDGRPRWHCTACPKTFSRQADLVRHALIHSGERPYQCDAPGCKYKGSTRADKLAQHKFNRGH